MASTAQKARCVHCRTDISVPDSYAHGDHIKCATCGTRHKVHRGDVLRLVIADVAPLKEALQANEQLVTRLEDELRGARRSIGIGANGLGIGVAYVLWQVALNSQPLSSDLAWQAGGVAVGSGLVLELANFLFLSKRQAVRRLGAELQEARAEGRHLQQKIREASRG
jgi:hypothetical protein